MCAHVWAQQSQDHGRGNSMSFTGDTLSSYQTPIARIVKRRRGKGRVMLLTSADYSVTTQQHKSRAWRAFEGEMFRVPSLGVTGGRHYEVLGQFPREREPNHRANMAYLVSEYKAECVRLKRKRVLWSSLMESLEDSARMPKGYATAFGFKDRIDVTADVADIEAHRAKAEAKRNTPAAIAKRERARVEREAEVAETLRLARLNAAEKLAEWRQGANVWLPVEAQKMEDGSAMLRVKPSDPAVLQTSQGAEVPMNHAHWAFERAWRARAEGSADVPTRGDVKVGHFTVDRIEADGSVRAGCHYIAWAEIEAFATAQGW